MKKNQEDTQRKRGAGWKRAVMKKGRKCSTWAFVIDIFYVTFSLYVGVSCWFKAPAMVAHNYRTTGHQTSRLQDYHTAAPASLDHTLYFLTPSTLVDSLCLCSLSALSLLNSNLAWTDKSLSLSPSCSLTPLYLLIPLFSLFLLISSLSITVGCWVYSLKSCSTTTFSLKDNLCLSTAQCCVWFVSCGWSQCNGTQSLTLFFMLLMLLSQMLCTVIHLSCTVITKTWLLEISLCCLSKRNLIQIFFCKSSWGWSDVVTCIPLDCPFFLHCSVDFLLSLLCSGTHELWPLLCCGCVRFARAKLYISFKKMQVLAIPEHLLNEPCFLWSSLAKSSLLQLQHQELPFTIVMIHLLLLEV